ncbi:Cytoskeleton-associated protein [Trachipleistophora hominis]|uniref:Cytoskeleton-associated protein n=1 Tax=Trachipleistophora hominis TaxID=72359 RepID=L7JSP4_TRAHO|nr:Cytoskeleton-associated protein [Trachipleistophora hominis]
MDTITLQINDKIYLGKWGMGTIRYIGTVKGDEGEYVGIELDIPKGKNDGSIDGTKYFTCKNNHGLFVPIDKLKKMIKGRQEPGHASVIMNKYKDRSIWNISDIDKKYVNQPILKGSENGNLNLKSDGINEEEGSKQQDALKSYNYKDNKVINDRNRTSVLNKEEVGEEKSVSKNWQGSPGSVNCEGKQFSIALEKMVDENLDNMNRDKHPHLDYKTLKMIYKTQKVYSDSKIRDLKSQIAELKKRCSENDNNKLISEVDRLRKENLKLKSSQMKNVRSREQIDEFILGMIKDCLKMKRSVDEALEILNRCSQKKIALSSEHINMFYLVKNLLFAILNDDEEKIDVYFEKFSAILKMNGIECSLD